jgi:AcrR family transcriptional regulator
LNVSTKSSPRVAGPARRRGGRRARERATRQAEVIAAARQLFARRGYQRTTMLQIAAASELALGTLYQLFPSKEAILYRMLDTFIDVLIARVRETAAEPGGAPAQIERVVRTQLQFSQDNADVLRFYLSGWTGYEFAVRQRFGERIDAKYEEYLGVLAGVFRRGMRDSGFAAAPPRRLAVALAGMIHALIRRWLREKDLNLVAEGDALVRLILCGVRRDGNRKAAANHD